MRNYLGGDTPITGQAFTEYLPTWTPTGGGGGGGGGGGTSFNQPATRYEGRPTPSVGGSSKQDILLLVLVAAIAITTFKMTRKRSME